VLAALATTGLCYEHNQHRSEANCTGMAWECQEERLNHSVRSTAADKHSSEVLRDNTTQHNTTQHTTVLQYLDTANAIRIAR